MTRDPRACHIPMPDFNHLSQGEVREHEQLEERFRKQAMSAQELARFRQLGVRRVIVQRETAESVA